MKIVRQIRRLANKMKLKANKELGIHAIQLFSSCSPGCLLSRPSLLFSPSYISPFDLFQFVLTPFFLCNEYMNIRPHIDKHNQKNYSKT